MVSYLKVPSFIATLGMMLLVRGGALYWVGGAPKGYLTDNWRQFGRNYIEDVPMFGRVPIALLILLVIAVISYFLFHRIEFRKADPGHRRQRPRQPALRRARPAGARR